MTGRQAGERHTPERTCVGCREVSEPERMERFVLFEGALLHDIRRRAPGRGAWVMVQRDCLERALKSGFARSFRSRIHPAPALDQIAREMHTQIARRLSETLQVGARARQLSVGALAVSEAMREHRARLVVLATDASDNTRQRYERNATRKQIPVFDEDVDGQTLGAWLGRDFVAVVSVDDDDRATHVASDIHKIRALQEALS